MGGGVGARRPCVFCVESFVYLVVITKSCLYHTEDQLEIQCHVSSKYDHTNIGLKLRLWLFFKGKYKISGFVINITVYRYVQYKYAINCPAMK